MEELAAQFIQCFNALRSPDQNAINQATGIIKQLSLNENAINTLIIILQQNQDSFIRFQAAISLKLSLRGIISSSFNPQNLIATLLTILSNEPEIPIRGYLVYILGESLINEPTVPLALNFAQAALASGNQQQIHSAIQLLNNLVGILNNTSNELIQLINQITLTAINFNNVKITLDTFEFYFSFTNKHHDQLDEVSNKIWSTAIAFIAPLTNDAQSFWEICAIMSDCIDFGASYVDVLPLIPICFQLFAAKEYDETIENAFILLFDSIIVCYPEQLLSTNILAPLFQKYAQLALKDYKPDDTVDLLNHYSIMGNICKSFSDNNDFVVTVWNMIKGLPQNDQGRYMSMIILKPLFNPEIDFFDEIMDEIVLLIATSFRSPSVATLEAGIDCFTEFVSVFTEIDDYIALFERTLIEVIKAKPTISLIEALTTAMKNAESTDDIYEEVFPILFYLISQSTAEANLTIIHSLSILSSRSYVGVLNHYQAIVALMQNLLTNNPEGNNILKSDANECLINLMRVSPDHFRPYLNSFVPLVLSFLSSQDPSLICSSINCIGTIVDLFGEEIKQAIPQILEAMAQFAAKDQSAHLENVKKLIEKGYTNDEIDEIAGTSTIDNDSLQMAGGAFLVYTSILVKFPEILPQYIVRAVELIKVLSLSYFSYSLHAVCKGVEFIMIAASETHFNAPPLMESIFANLKLILERTDDIEIFGEAIFAISAVIHASGLQALGPHIQSLPIDIVNILTCNMNCFEVDRTTLPDCLYSPLTALFFTLYDILSPQDSANFMKDIIPVILQLAGKTNKEKAFALDLLVNYAKHGFNPSPDFLPNILNLAVECASNNFSSGFIALELMSSFAADLLRANSERLLQLYMAKLTQKKKKSQNKYQSMVDCCVSSLGAFAMLVLGDNFPLQQFGQIALSKMPPRQDLEETAGCYNFLNWMIPRGIAFLRNDFIAAFARLFAQSPNKIKQMQISPEDLNIYKQTFIKLLQVTKDSDQIWTAAVGNDPVKIQYIQNALKP